MEQARIESDSEDRDKVAECRHCKTQLESHKAVFIDSDNNSFCCPGCRAVYGLLADKGLLHYYTFNDRIGSRAKSPKYEEKNELNLDLLVDDGKSSASIDLVGIHCASCVWLLERLPSIVDGVSNARVSLANGQLAVSWDPSIVDLQRIILVVEQLGYRAIPKSTKTNKENSREDLVRIGIAGASAMNIMVLAVSLYQGEFTGIEARHETLFRWVSFALATPAVLFSAIPIYVRAIAALKSEALHIDIPIALGIILSFALSAINTIRGSGTIYFDSVATIIFLLLASRHLHQRAFNASRRSFTSSWSLLPHKINEVAANGEIHELPIQSLQAGMLLLVRPGERIPCDGIIESGESLLDCSTITGEPLPQVATTNSGVLAGCLNIESPLTIKSATDAGSSQLDRILAAVSARTGSPSIFISSFDNLSSIFTAATILLSIAAFLGHIGTSWDSAMSAAIAMLTVTCPCSVALALPLLSIRALATSAKQGILIATSNVFDDFTKIKHFYFDKTGTLTVGHPEVTTAYEIGLQSCKDALVEAVLKELTHVQTSHPISKAIASFYDSFREKDPVIINTVSAKLLPGRGVVITYLAADKNPINMQTAALYSLNHYIQEYGSDNIPNNLAENTTLVVLVIDSSPILLFELTDKQVENAHLVIEDLGKSGAISILSGDRTAVVHSLAAKLGINTELCHGGLKPEDKALLLKNTKEAKLFIGDGANDAPALLAADVGVALRGGIQSLLECADVCIVDGGIEQILALKQLSQHYRKVARLIILIGLTYNGVGIIAAMFGLVTPLVAAVAMPVLSSILITIAYAAFTWSKPWT